MFFLESIKEGKPTFEAHKNLLRFGLGEYKREKIKVKIGKKIDVSTGFEYLNTLQRIFLESVNDIVLVKGRFIGDKKVVSKILDDFNIEPVKIVGKKFEVNFKMDKEKLKELKDVLFENNVYFLANFSSKDASLKSKNNFPKPGNLVENFAKLSIPLDAKSLILKAFVLPDFNKTAEIETTYVINNIVVDENLLKENPEKARLESKRDLTVKRKLLLDKVESEDSFSALV